MKVKGIEITEHRELDFLKHPDVLNSKFDLSCFIQPQIFPSKRNSRPCFKAIEKQSSIFLKADYYVGVDWLIEDEYFIQVKPKLNTQVLQRFEEESAKTLKDADEKLDVEEIPSDINKEDNFEELDFIRLLLDAFSNPVVSKYTNELITIDWQKKPIPIQQKEDYLTPFLVVQYLNLLKQIVKKGLKKSYYKVQENLNNRVKGKILVGANIKQNIFKNRFTKTYCEYQEFGINHQENKFLKKVLYFCSNYVYQNAAFFEQNKVNIEHLINYSKPAFELVSDDIEASNLKNIKYNPFFKEYKEAIKIGNLILKRFAYNISNTSIKNITVPPFWIDMPKLFELYVYRHLLQFFYEKEIKFQFSTSGNALDFLIKKQASEMVIDAKYKMRYCTSHIHEDIRQVAGYARLNKVYEELKATKAKTDVIDCLIIYPTDKKLTNEYKFKCILDDESEIKAYNRVYKIGIPMPYLK